MIDASTPAPGEAASKLIDRYRETWGLLLAYDQDEIGMPPGVTPPSRALQLDDALAAIDAMRQDLACRGEASELFGKPRGKAFEAIFGNVDQTMFGERLYPSREEKAANLLYFVIKGHPFSDGNKRIGAMLFLLCLDQEEVPHAIDPKALTALTLLIAASAPADKDAMVSLTVNLVVGPEGPRLRPMAMPEVEASPPEGDAPAASPSCVDSPPAP